MAEIALSSLTFHSLSSFIFFILLRIIIIIILPSLFRIRIHVVMAERKTEIILWHVVSTMHDYRSCTREREWQLPPFDRHIYLWIFNGPSDQWRCHTICCFFFSSCIIFCCQSFPSAVHQNLNDVWTTIGCFWLKNLKQKPRSYVIWSVHRANVGNNK